MNYPDEEMCEIFGLPKITCKNYGENEIGHHVVVEFTLNHPHTKAWAKLSKFAKEKLYYRFYFNVRDTYFMAQPYDSDIAIEDTGDHVHAHGYFAYDTKQFKTKTYAHCGIVCDIVGEWLRLLPKRYNHCLRGNTYDNYDAWWKRIRIPQCNVQIITDDAARLDYWKAYIAKQQEILPVPV